MRVLLSIDMPMRGKRQRQAATKMRKDLEDAGFTSIHRNLFSRVIGGRESIGRNIKRIEAALPECCAARVFTMTERQYADIQMINDEKSEQELLVDARRQLVF